VRALLEAEPSQIQHDLYHLGSGMSLSIREIARAVKNEYRKLYAKDVEVAVPPSSRPAETKTRFRLDINRIQELGFRPGPADIMRTQIGKIFKLLESG